MFYRIRQFRHAIHPKFKIEELDWAKSILPPNAMQLFLSQPLPEQRHALDVALDLWTSGIRDNHLLIAALLHDCGKGKNPLKVWERIIIVLLQKLPLPVWNNLLQTQSPFSGPLRTAQEHPQWSAEMAAAIGLSPQVVELISQHHNPNNHEGYILFAADNRH